MPFFICREGARYWLWRSGTGHYPKKYDQPESKYLSFLSRSDTMSDLICTKRVQFTMKRTPKRSISGPQYILQGLSTNPRSQLFGNLECYDNTQPTSHPPPVPQLLTSHVLNILKRPNIDHTKIYTVDLDFPCQELSIRGLGFVVALLVFQELIFYVRLLGVQSSCNLQLVWLLLGSLFLENVFLGFFR